MFAGIAAIILNEDNTVINGIASREGEEVRLEFIVVLQVYIIPFYLDIVSDLLLFTLWHNFMVNIIYNVIKR